MCSITQHILDTPPPSNVPTDYTSMRVETVLCWSVLSMPLGDVNDQYYLLLYSPKLYTKLQPLN